MTYKMVVFDWDGTILDSTGAITRAIQGACVDAGLPDPGEEIASYVIGLGLSDALRHAAPGASEVQIALLDAPCGQGVGLGVGAGVVAVVGLGVGFLPLPLAQPRRAQGRRREAAGRAGAQGGRGGRAATRRGHPAAADPRRCLPVR